MIRKTRASQAPVPASVPANASPRISPFAMVVAVIVLLAAAGLGIKNAFKTNAAPAEQTVSATSAPADEVQALIAKVSRLIVTKQDETPTVATVQDADLLRKQNPEFYREAQNGDRLIIWSDKAVLYSSSRNLILAVLPVSLPPTSATSTSATASSTASIENPPIEHPTFDIRNGSGVPGLAKNMAAQLKEAGYTVPAAKNAVAKMPYPQTLVIQLSQKELPQTSENLRNLLGYTIQPASAAPASELPSSADFLVIVGQDAVK